ncbi:LolA family protein [Risungbinella massiliensis]|uniref:LolA family protein n=1 Tax=Risungbinella massiliensis TaxID=1329796 RepID=UPI0005CC6E26|nr:hypothetical protein [Risungbinella massiliensis]
MKHKDLFSIIGLAGLIITGVVGCSSTEAVTPDKIVDKLLADAEKSPAFYAEYKMDEYNEDKLQTSTKFKEWRDSTNTNAKVEATDSTGKKNTTWKTGTKLLSYEEGAPTAMEVSFEGEETILGINQRESLMKMIGQIQKTHDFQNIGTEQILGRNTHHLLAKPKQNQKSIFGEMELWVDHESWIPTKFILQTGNTKSIVEYTKLEISPKWPADLFEAKLPANVTIQKIDSSTNQEKIITPAEAEKILGKKVLALPKPYQLEKVTALELKGELNRTEVSYTYLKDGVPALTLTVFPSPGGPIADIDLGEEKITVRGKEGSYMEVIKNINWDEDGLRYGIMITHPDLKKEEILKVLADI